LKGMNFPLFSPFIIPTSLVTRLISNQRFGYLINFVFFHFVGAGFKDKIGMPEATH